MRKNELDKGGTTVNIDRGTGSKEGGGKYFDARDYVD